MGSSLFRSSSRIMPALLYALAYLMMASAKETHLHSNASFVGGSLSDDTGFYADDTLMRKAGISSEVRIYQTFPILPAIWYIISGVK